MKLGILLILFAFIVFVVVMRRRVSKDISAPVRSLPHIVKQLETAGSDGAFVVFMFSLDPEDDPLPNVQFSIERGKLGFDWVLIAPRNIADKEAIVKFASSLGHSMTEQEANGVSYLRTDDQGVADLCLKILKEFYGLPESTSLQIIAQGFAFTLSNAPSDMNSAA